MIVVKESTNRPPVQAPNSSPTPEWLRNEKMKSSFKRWTRPGIAILAIIFFACSSSHAPSIAEKLPPALQSTLNEINAIGTRGNREQKYFYVLEKGCDLRITKFLNAHPIKQLVFSLKDTQFSRYDFAPGLGYAVRTTNQGDLINFVVFDDSALESIHDMLDLLEKIKLECTFDSMQGGHPN